MKRPRILIAEPDRFSAQASARLREVGEVTRNDLDRTGLLTAVRDADVLWVRLRHRIDEEVLAAGQHLRVVVTPTTGLNHIDLAAARRRGIEVLSLRGEVDFLKDIRATAEHTLGLMLALLRHLPAASQHVVAGGWNRDKFVGHELCNTTVGIVGYGRLGRLVARYLLPFDAQILVADPRLNADDVPDGVQPVSLETLLDRSNIVTLHVDLSDETAGFFGRDQFAAMPQGALFINTARGELIDEAALLQALRSGQLSGAAVDVLTDEQSAGMGHNLLVQYAKRHDNLIITPHIGGCTAESMAKTEDFLAEKLCAELLEYSVTA